MSTLKLTLPKRQRWQQQVVEESKRFNVVNCGRRSGKSTLGIDRCATKETLTLPVGWFSPTYKMLLEVWREAVRTFAPITARRSAQDHRLEFVTGGLLEFWSLDNPDVARGRKYRRVIVDEAAMIPSLMDSWNYVLRPTLVDYSGDAYFMSTPKGRNGFWQMWQMGQDAANGEWASWQMPTSVNPFIPQSEIEAMRQAMPERIYAQEINADFIEDGGGVFRHVVESATLQPADRLPGHHYVMGVDLARKIDFTVCVVLDVSVNPLQVVFMDRFNQIGWETQIGRIKALVDRFGVEEVIVDQTGVGDPVVERLQKELLV